MRKIKEFKNKMLFTAIYVVSLLLFASSGIGCVFRKFLHFPCPGCGMTRAWLSFLQLDFASAFSYHPMFWSLPLLYLYLLYDGSLFQKKWLDRGILILIAIGFLLFWLFSLLKMSNL